MFAQMTIGKKLTTGFAAMVVCVLGLSYFSLSAVNRLRGLLDETANKTARKLDLSGAISRDVSQMRAEIRGMILSAALKNAVDQEMYRGNFLEAAGQAEQLREELQPLLSTERAKKGAQDAESGLPKWKEVFAEVARLWAAGLGG